MYTARPIHLDMSKWNILISTEENVKFGERPFDDVHVLSGTLKLYFRELPEPLIPFDAYDQFIDAISKYDLYLLEDDSA